MIGQNIGATCTPMGASWEVFRIQFFSAGFNIQIVGYNKSHKVMNVLS